MQVGKRKWSELKWVLARRETYLSLVRALWVVKRPIRTMFDEVFSASLRRKQIVVRTPIGAVEVRLRSAVDLSTVLGVFCREDYAPPPDSRVMIDVGANIGVATLYFLSRSGDTFVYAYEPVVENSETFRKNVERFENRCELTRVAVGPSSGDVDFGLEPTGKFGGIHVPSEHVVRVPCLAINEIVERVLSKHGGVDCLKVDVEGSEREILAALDHRFWSRIRCIYAENCDSRELMPPGFVRRLRYNVERLTPA